MKDRDIHHHGTRFLLECPCVHGNLGIMRSDRFHLEQNYTRWALRECRSRIPGRRNLGCSHRLHDLSAPFADDLAAESAQEKAGVSGGHLQHRNAVSSMRVFGSTRHIPLGYRYRSSN